VHRVAEIKPQEAKNAHEGILFHLAAVAPKDWFDQGQEPRRRGGGIRVLSVVLHEFADPKEREEQEERDLLKKLLSNVRKKYQCTFLAYATTTSLISQLMPLLPNIVVNMRLTITVARPELQSDLRAPCRHESAPADDPVPPLQQPVRVGGHQARGSPPSRGLQRW
jgi:hypothetical protein